MEENTLRDLGIKLWNAMRNGEDIEQKIVSLNIPDAIARSSVGELTDFILAIYSDNPEIATKLLDISREGIMKMLQKASPSEIKNAVLLLGKHSPTLAEKFVGIFAGAMIKILEVVTPGQMAGVLRELQEIDDNLAVRIVTAGKDILVHIDYLHTPLTEIGYFLAVLYEINDDMAREIINAIIPSLCQRDFSRSGIEEIGRLLWAVSRINVEKGKELLECQYENILKTRIPARDIESVSIFFLGLASIGGKHSRMILNQKKNDLERMSVRKFSLVELCDLIWTVSRIDMKTAKELMEKFRDEIVSRINVAGIKDIRRFIWKLGTFSKELAEYAYKLFRDAIITRLREAEVSSIVKFVGVINVDNPPLAKEIASDVVPVIKERMERINSLDEFSYALELVAFAEGQDSAMRLYKKFAEQMLLGEDIEKRIQRPLKPDRYEDLMFLDELRDVSSKMFYRRRIS